MIKHPRTWLVVLLLAGAATSAALPAAAAGTQKHAKMESAAAQKTLTGEVVGVNEKNVALLVDGAVVDVKADHETSIEGSPTKLHHRIESRLDHAFHPGDQAKVVLSREKLENRAVSIEHAGAAGMAQAAPGEAGRARAAERTEPMKAETFKGTVLGVHHKDLVVDMDGVAVKLRADHETKLNGKATKKDHTIDRALKQDFKVGQHVTAEYQRYRNENRALSISSD